MDGFVDVLFIVLCELIYGFDMCCVDLVDRIVIGGFLDIVV